MKLINKFIDKHGAGHVTLRPEDDEDMWHLYNLIQEGDLVRAPAVRRVTNVSATGSTESHRVRLNLTLQVKKVVFSPAGAPANQEGGGDQDEDSPSSVLHIIGPVTSENAYVKLGAFHTLDIEAFRDVRIEKEDGWDSIALGRVEEAIVPGRGAEVGAVVCEILFDSVRLFLRHIPYTNASLKAIVIASPGWVRDAVYDYIMTEALNRGDKVLHKAMKEKCIKVHISSPHVHSLVEVLKSPEVSNRLKETKFAREGITLDKFFKMLGSDEMRAWYGPDHVRLAADRGAIGTLLISDDLFRSSDPSTRKKYQKGGEVVIFSSMHESGQQLNQLTGIAAILTFPLDVEVVEAEEREEEEERKSQLEEAAATDA
ncbi:eRF1 domain 1-domain-containing protein [Flammula alnicola]|nr:eRF1 domain 1-domain-containing protein [Flammula alnicola]